MLYDNHKQGGDQRKGMVVLTTMRGLLIERNTAPQRLKDARRSLQCAIVRENDQQVHIWWLRHSIKHVEGRGEAHPGQSIEQPRNMPEWNTGCRGRSDTVAGDRGGDGEVGQGDPAHRGGKLCAQEHGQLLA